MSDFIIKKGFDVNLDGRPAPDVETLTTTGTFAVYPSEFPGIKPRVKVKEGDRVKRGQILFENKKDERMVFRSPACGRVASVRLGARRAPLEIRIEAAENEERETLPSHTRESLSKLSREETTNLLLAGGLWGLIRQRPFSKVADPDAEPKAIFVNACNSAPFQADAAVVVAGEEEAFRMGLAALSKLTEGPVHLCRPKNSALPAFEEVENHTFSGPHPSGNASVHVNRISPILPHDVVYTLRAQDVVLLGKQLRSGEPPRETVVALGGPAVKAPFRKHYRVPFGGGLGELFSRALPEAETRIVAGHALWGEAVESDACARAGVSEYTVLEEDRSRHVLGWTTPGANQYSAHRVTLGALLRNRVPWNLGTNLHGGRRAMVVTGWYDKHQPLNVMTDYLVRAILAHDLDEAVKLGLLEVDPEDFALAAFVDPAKTDLCGIVRRGLDELEKEGI